MYRIAHRGASGYEPENSLAAFHYAVELGVDYIEADVQYTKDKVGIIRHDHLLNRTTTMKGAINEHSFEEIQKNARLSNGESILSLEQLCHLVKELRTQLYIDLKSFDHAVEAAKLTKSILPTSQFIFGAFHAEAIRKVKQLDNKIQTVLIMEGNFINLEKEIEDCQCDIVAMGFDAIDKTTIERTRNIGKKVFVWTVNSNEDIARAKSLGVDGITSNYPDKI